MKWKADALRHSFASYWLATFPDAPALAMLMGNSPAMIFRHYNDPKFRDEAAKWWKIRPKNLRKIQDEGKKR